MLGPVARLFWAEMTKAWRTKLPYLGLFSSALMAIVARQSIQEFSQPGGISAPDYFTASVNLSSTIVIPVFGTIFGAMLVASETSRGTLRTILTRPVTRTQFLTAKLLSGFAYLLLLFLANLIPALLIARSYPLQAADDRDIAIPGILEQVRIFGTALALTIIPQLATICFAFLVSVISANVATAIGVALGILLSLQPVKEFINFGDFRLDPWLFSSYYDTAMGIANSKAGGIYEVWIQSKTYMLVGTSFVSMALCLAIGYWIFSRRDMNF